MYILGPTDSIEHRLFVDQLQQVLDRDLPPLTGPFVEAAEYQAPLREKVEVSLLAMATQSKWKHFLNRLTNMQFNVYIDKRGSTGIMQFDFVWHVEPHSLVCHQSDGTICLVERKL